MTAHAGQSAGDGRPVSRRELLRILGATALAIPLAACSKSPGASNARPPSGSAPPTGGGAAAAAGAGLKIGSAVPAIESEAIEGPPVTLETYRGHPFLLNFWASTCDPCVREFPLLKQVLERHSDLPIIGVDVLERKEAAVAFTHKADATWPSIWDQDGSISLNQFHVRVLPVTFAVGRNFTIIDRQFGELTEKRLDAMVEAIYRS